MYIGTCLLRSSILRCVSPLPCPNPTHKLHTTPISPSHTQHTPPTTSSSPQPHTPSTSHKPIPHQHLNPHSLSKIHILLPLPNTSLHNRLLLSRRTKLGPRPALYAGRGPHDIVAAGVAVAQLGWGVFGELGVGERGWRGGSGTRGRRGLGLRVGR